MTWEPDVEPRPWFDATSTTAGVVRRPKWGELVASWTFYPDLDELGTLAAHEYIEPPGQRVFVLWIEPPPLLVEAGFGDETSPAIPRRAPTRGHAEDFLRTTQGGIDGFTILDPILGSVQPQRWRRIVANPEG